MKEHPFEFNPFRHKKFDFTNNIPETPKELPDKKKSGVHDDERIYSSQQEPAKTKETTIIKQDFIGSDNMV